MHISSYTFKTSHAYFIYKTPPRGRALVYGTVIDGVLTVMVKRTDKKNTANAPLSSLRPLASGRLRMQLHWEEGSIASEHMLRSWRSVAAH